MAKRMIGTLDGATHVDDESYLDFIEGMRVFSSGGMNERLLARDGEILDGFRSQAGRPATIDDVRATYDGVPIIQASRRIFRSTQDMRAVALIETYEKRRAELEAELDAASTRGPGKLLLDPELTLPDYYTPVYFHNQPGGYFNHPLAGYIYHYGTNILFHGKNDQDALHAGMVNGVPLPADGQVRRVLDLACAIGQSTTEWKRRVPGAEVIGVDIASPMLRYAHKRANDMGLDVTFMQMAAEDLRFPDNNFDVVHCFILFHEVPVPVGEQVLRNVFRVLRPGGVFAVLDVGQAPAWTPIDAYQREFIIRDNAEPYEIGWAHWDFASALRNTGFVPADKSELLDGHLGSSSAHHSRWMATKPV
jgi:SAM-dependent methyltransferase